VSDAAYFVLRRGSAAWAIARSSVRGLARRGERIDLALEGAAIDADAVLGVAAGMAVTPPGAVLRRYWPEPCAGLAVWAGLPVVVVNAGELPAPLRRSEGDPQHGRRTH